MLVGYARPFMSIQDFVVNPKMILMQWRVGKLSHEQCLEDLLATRDANSLRLIEFVQGVREQERERRARREREVLLWRLENGLGAFRGHDNITKFLEQFEQARTRNPKWRFRFLLLRGRTRMGKSQKAMSLYGIKGSLLVNCQGLGTSLPSLRSVVRGETLCIVFDEISAEQVLANKLVFQAGPWPVTLGQSACGQHAYSLDLYALPMICCSNDFKTTEADGLSADAAEWLEENKFEASPPKGGPWYYEADPHLDKPVLPF